MTYAEKIKYAEIVAKDLQDKKTLDQIEHELKDKGLYENDIINVIVSARNMIGEKLKPLIRTKLLSGESIPDSDEFKNLDNSTLEKLIQQERESIAIGEKKKVSSLLKDGKSTDEILKAIRLEFYPKQNIEHQIAIYQNVKKQNSGSTRMLKILLGLAVIILGAGISYVTIQEDGSGRLFYGLILLGIYIMIKGFMTAKIPE